MKTILEKKLPHLGMWMKERSKAFVYRRTVAMSFAERREKQRQWDRNNRDTKNLGQRIRDMERQQVNNDFLLTQGQQRKDLKTMDCGWLTPDQFKDRIAELKVQRESLMKKNRESKAALLESIRLSFEDKKAEVRKLEQMIEEIQPYLRLLPLPEPVILCKQVFLRVFDNYWFCGIVGERPPDQRGIPYRYIYYEDGNYQLLSDSTIIQSLLNSEGRKQFADSIKKARNVYKYGLTNELLPTEADHYCLETAVARLAHEAVLLNEEFIAVKKSLQ